MSRRFTVVTVALAASVAFLIGLDHGGRDDADARGVERAPGGAEPRLCPAGGRGRRRPPPMVNFADVAERINAAVVNIDSTSKLAVRASRRAIRAGGTGRSTVRCRVISTPRARDPAAAS